MPARILAVVPETRKRAWLRALVYGGLWMLAHLLREPRLQGYIGELRVHNGLRNSLPDGSLILSDVLLPTPQGTAQVDLVAIVGQHVFAIEVKNRAGYVSGRERDRLWQWQVGHRHGTFYNPVSQSRRHAQYLGQILGRWVEPVVVFAGTARVDSDAPMVFDTPRWLVPTLLEICPDVFEAQDLAVQSRVVAPRPVLCACLPAPPHDNHGQ